MYEIQNYYLKVISRKLKANCLFNIITTQYIWFQIKLNSRNPRLDGECWVAMQYAIC